jgi:hypothetical protein
VGWTAIGYKRARSAAGLTSRPQQRPAGDKEHRRATDRLAGAISPQKLYGTPVGLMFFEGAPRLLRAGVTIPGVHIGDPERVAVEAYPGLLARALIGRRSYKQDSRARQTAERNQARRALLQAILGGAAQPDYGVWVQAPLALAGWSIGSPTPHCCSGWLASPVSFRPFSSPPLPACWPIAGTATGCWSLPRPLR